MPILVCGLSEPTRNIHMNQGLTAQWTALKRRQTQPLAPDSLHQRQKLRQTPVMFPF